MEKGTNRLVIAAGVANQILVDCTAHHIDLHRAFTADYCARQEGLPPHISVLVKPRSSATLARAYNGPESAGRIVY